MLTDVYIFYIFVYTYTCNDMRSVVLKINKYDDDAKIKRIGCRQRRRIGQTNLRGTHSPRTLHASGVVDDDGLRSAECDIVIGDKHAPHVPSLC